MEATTLSNNVTFLFEVTSVVSSVTARINNTSYPASQNSNGLYRVDFTTTAYTAADIINGDKFECQLTSNIVTPPKNVFSNEIAIVVNPATGLELGSGIEIFSNPTEDEVTIVLPERVRSSLHHINLISAQGAVLAAYFEASTKLRLSLKPLVLGLYFININSGAGVVNFKIIRK